MTTNAELIAEARRAYEYGVIDDFGGGASKDDVIGFVPQLADAAEAADMKLADLYAACHAAFLTFDHPNWRGDDETIEPIRDLMNLVPFDQRTKEEQQAVQLSRRTRLAEAEARLAKAEVILREVAKCDHPVYREPAQEYFDGPARPMEPGT